MAYNKAEKTDSSMKRRAPRRRKKVCVFCGENNGVVTNVDDWGKKRLAYEIQKSKEAYYYFIQFDGDAECPGEVERHIRIMEPVVRYLCVKQEA